MRCLPGASACAFAYSCRITFARGLRYRLVHGSPELGGRDEDMTYYGDQGSVREEDAPVVLEIKVATSVPVWAVELVRRFCLVQRGYSKYCYAITAATAAAGLP